MPGTAGDKDGAYEALCRTLQYDKPRSEFCCRLGALLLEKGQLHPATYWYELAIQLPRDNDSMGMKNGIFIPGCRISNWHSVMIALANTS